MLIGQGRVPYIKVGIQRRKDRSEGKIINRRCTVLKGLVGSLEYNSGGGQWSMANGYNLGCK